MKLIQKIFHHIVFASAFLSLHAQAQGIDEPLKIDFIAHRVTLDDQQEEVLTPAETAFPGDLIQYIAVYTNTGEERLTNIRPVIPVPRGMSLIMKSVKPEAIDASVDGVRFSPLPLIDDHGKPIPHDRIRALRWHLPELSSDRSVTLTFRVKVDS